MNGLIRTLCESREVLVVTKRSNVSDIRVLYGDLNNLRFRFVDSWSDLYMPAGGGPRYPPRESVLDRLEELGYSMTPLSSFREACPYDMLGVSPRLAHTGFSLAARNTEAERALWGRVQAEVGPAYCVVHEDEDRPIHRHLLPDLPLVSVRDPRWRTASVTDWITVMDNAVQLHGVDSCFLMLADLLCLKARKYCHAYAGKGPFRPSVYSDVIVIWGLNK